MTEAAPTPQTYAPARSADLSGAFEVSFLLGRTSYLVTRRTNGQWAVSKLNQAGFPCRISSRDQLHVVRRFKAVNKID